MELALIRGTELGFQLESVASDGMRLDPGSRVLRLIGSAEEVARGEEDLLACVGKASGVATASARLLGRPQEGSGSCVAPGKRSLPDCGNGCDKPLQWAVWEFA